MIGIGTSVGHYVLSAQLGEGAMGTVFLAQHRLLDTRVAIKVIRKDVERSEEDVARFFNEARAASRIGHENIVSVIDFGHTPEGDPYYIMEHLAGETLGARLARGRLTLPEVLHIGAQIAGGLAAAHDKGIVHRDLKPANVLLVRRSDDRSFVKLLDFGVAKLVSFDDEERGHRTHTGRLLGTPHYMSPEQVTGRRAVDGRADVYALGVLLFEMLAGKLPFDAPKWTEVLIQQVTQSPPRLAEQPAWLVDLVDRMLAKPREQRPAMSQVVGALRSQAAPVDEPERRPDATLDASVSLASVSLPERKSLEQAETLAGPNASSRPSAPPLVTPPAPPTAPTLRPRRRLAMAMTASVGLIVVGVAFSRRDRDPEPVPPSPPAYLSPAEIERQAKRAELVASWAEKRAELEKARSYREVADALGDAGLPMAPPDIEVFVPPVFVPPVPPVSPAPPTKVRGPGKKLDGFDIEKALSGTRDSVALCGRKYTELLNIKVTMRVDSEGDVTGVYLPRKYTGTPFEMCVTRAITEESEFPPFEGDARTISEDYGIPP